VDLKDLVKPAELVYEITGDKTGDKVLNRLNEEVKEYHNKKSK